MAYRDFAYWYDTLNEDADYNRLAKELLALMHGYGLEKGIIADLGCGTGELTMRIADAGFEMIGIDSSSEMLSVFREKLYPDVFVEATSASYDILLLCQNLKDLDLYGTIHGAISTFDTLNHLPLEELEKAIEKIALFLEEGGIFIFDVNTPYKHKEILAENVFKVEGKNNIVCIWENEYQPETQSTQIELTGECDGKELFRESFCEFCYPLSFWQNILTKNGFTVVDVRDGESFCSLEETTQRFLITAIKSQRGDLDE